MDKIARDLGIKGGLTFGMARHYLFNYMNQSEDFIQSEIQQIALHSKISTTENYLSSLRQNKVNATFEKIRK